MYLQKQFYHILQPRSSKISLSVKLKPVTSPQTILLGGLVTGCVALQRSETLLLHCFIPPGNSYNSQSMSSPGVTGLMVNVSVPLFLATQVYHADWSSEAPSPSAKQPVEASSLSRPGPESLSVTKGDLSHKTEPVIQS